MTGKWLDDWHEPRFRERILGTYTRAVETGEPQHAERRTFDDERPRSYEFLTLPLSSDGVTIDKMISAMVYLG